jgi:hypothetical protein
VPSESKNVVSQANPPEISDEIPSRHWSDFWIGLTVLVAFCAGGAMFFRLLFG